MARTSFVDSFYQSLDDLAGEIAETLTQFPNALPDDVCAVGEEADFEKVKEHVSELLTNGDFEEIESMLSDADDEREESAASPSEESSHHADEESTNFGAKDV